jgi:hypothetical protein
MPGNSGLHCPVYSPLRRLLALLLAGDIVRVDDFSVCGSLPVGQGNPRTLKTTSERLSELKQLIRTIKGTDWMQLDNRTLVKAIFAQRASFSGVWGADLQILEGKLVPGALLRSRSVSTASGSVCQGSSLCARLRACRRGLSVRFCSFGVRCCRSSVSIL